MVWCFSLILVVATVYSSSPSTAAYECGFPGRPSHGHVNVTINQDTRISFPIGTIVLYKCPKPYHELQGLKQRICLENGKWSGTRPWCETNIAYGKKTTFHDDEGYREEPTITDGNNEPEDRNCRSLRPGSNSSIQIDLKTNHTIDIIKVHLQDEDVKNGRMLVNNQECRTSNRTNKMITFECRARSAHSLQGQFVRFEYSGEKPIRTCEIKVLEKPDGFECGEPEVPANGNVKMSKSSSFKFAQYECEEGYQLIGFPNRTCHRIHWQGQAPVCQPVPLKSDEMSVKETSLADQLTEPREATSQPTEKTETNPSLKTATADLEIVVTEAPSSDASPVMIAVVSVCAVLLLLGMGAALRKYLMQKKNNPQQAIYEELAGQL